jgi:hypothetical protein
MHTACHSLGLVVLAVASHMQDTFCDLLVTFARLAASTFRSGTSGKPSHPDGFRIIGLFTLLPRRRAVRLSWPVPKVLDSANKATLPGYMEPVSAL